MPSAYLCSRTLRLIGVNALGVARVSGTSERDLRILCLQILAARAAVAFSGLTGITSTAYDLVGMSVQHYVPSAFGHQVPERSLFVSCRPQGGTTVAYIRLLSPGVYSNQVA